MLGIRKASRASTAGPGASRRQIKSPSVSLSFVLAYFRGDVQCLFYTRLQSFLLLRRPLTSVAAGYIKVPQC